jgi:hypothetical protein
VRDELRRQRVEDQQGMDLRLVREGEGARHLERQARLGGPRQVKARGATGVQLVLKRAHPVALHRERERGPALVVHLPLVEETQQPRLGLAVAVDIGPQHVVVVVGSDPGEGAALQQRHLRGGVAGGDRADPARLDDRDLLTRAGQEDGHREAGDAGARHDGVEATAVGEGARRCSHGGVGSEPD